MHLPKVMKLAALTAASALALSACSSSPAAEKTTETTAPETTASEEASAEATFPRTITHAQGETTIEAMPEKIVVLDMAVLDTIDAIGAGDRVVGTVTKSVPTWLKDDDGIDYSQLTSVGNLKEPDMEAIAKLQPDLVIVGGRSSSFYEEFSKTFTTIDATHSWDTEDYSTTVPDNVKMVAQAVGADAKGMEAADSITAKIAQYTDMAKDKGNALVIMTNAGEISLHDRGSRWAPIWDVFGFGQAYEKPEADEGHKGDKVSFETVKEINPDWIFVVDRDAAVGKAEAGDTAEQVLDNELVNSTTAAKEGHIVYLSPERWYIVMTGATNFPAMLDEVADAIK
ncbi:MULTISPECIES: siderophore ABC transporter substrate-binding protein [Trueperella]|uniref:ABC transporter substrate-binding protein n=2 Tax=Trueperella bernardiae TaxID=59561 RepID=A0AAW6ZG88_9ACTO|nr:MULTISPECIES: ABC transporter substrate-binding protein [Trueperella]MCM3908016.1 ABC transporter substrate-binding protein [Trueperella bernardiae]MDK8602807.1 ABC transporter substrate-binding protein [Trueperella bernardiae]WIM07937.1 ABC transporter substrate-binding protein [Trueperella bernardiae]